MKCQKDFKCQKDNKCHKECECNKCHKECEWDKCHKECECEWNKCHKECHKECERDRCPREAGGERHVHEYSSSVKLAEERNDRHDHRVAGVTGQAIPIKGGKDHVHRINDNTDFFDHFHIICVTTGPAIEICDENGRPTGKHIHLVKGNTTIFDEHCHAFLFTTDIEAPLLPLEECKADDY